jgi:hypothetical protein
MKTTTTLYSELLILVDLIIEEVEINSKAANVSLGNMQMRTAIEYISLALDYSPQAFIRHTSEGICYDIHNLKKVREQIILRQEEDKAVWNLRTYAK